jgi:hypothetical protein
MKSLGNILEKIKDKMGMWVYDRTGVITRKNTLNLALAFVAILIIFVIAYTHNKIATEVKTDVDDEAVILEMDLN